MTNAAQALDPTRLTKLLAEQRDLYLRLRDLSEQQRSLISSDRPEQLLNILRERQSLVGALARLNEQLAPFRRNWEGLYRGLPEDEREKANGLLQEINGLLQLILKTDQEDGALLSARKQNVADQMRGLSGGSVANAAYAQQAGGRTSHAADVTG